ncbi:MAG: type II toxin-antitoxin system HigB family toxin [Cytophagaceae bacterium]|nr:type II toxin-antitoxin system HigB family toxin [Cytophagaceae bacterium]MBK9509121.1 type II toxin-antitoxin system HigB family toxin [Cytophagaceae bacterium]MBK9933881.1 type II toxin-antitoxin system HigB family toxin [Cytophagaceae bacterium]MBL0302402.1 type II toxin-antitoxin system HigB family toxin [Cytophagaceae bacterium]MBL0325228.1 type II toxin-antitoxin system HigB family toxin [Cytophagaceae bacterium]
MKIYSKGTLRKFWDMYPDARPSLETWYSIVEATSFKEPGEITRLFKNADSLKNNRIIFNICRNKYRLIVKFEFQFQSAYVRFIGTHKEYDKIVDIHNV